MKLRLTLTIIMTAIFIISKAQTIDSIEAKANYGSKISDVQLLMELENIDYYKVQFKNSSKSRYLHLVTKEYWNGKVTKCDTLLTAEYAKENFKLKENDTSSTLSLITKPLGDSVLFNYRFLGMSLSRKYRRAKSDQYSLRDGLVTNEKFKKIPTDKIIPLFVYSLPYEDPKQPGYLFYCALTANGVPPEQWWEKYKVRHYIVLEMKIITQ
ncbi:hypothetical protein [Pedobacter sandarakinus]|uniref:hypothetical protein n=1 Tax=Pedobacter sandarakinus TaxID=353156 RepID=UPI0022477EFA|nr:hypothetical protein [Pedobacter sandarakinus]MCX2574978.1 hypothetical protein [Pedobacter sandarakinus]